MAINAMGVIGAAHCGSTAFNLTMDGLPGVSGVGESHWLIDKDKLSASQGWIDRNWPCRTCGSDCEILNDGLIAALSNGGGWWEKISEAYHGDKIISTDKRPKHFDRFGIPSKIVVLYRDPDRWVASWLNHHPEHQIGRATGIWNRIYTTSIEWCNEHRVEWTSVCWDDFRGPHRGYNLYKLCEWLELDFDIGALDIASRLHHHVGGYNDVVTTHLLGYDTIHLSLETEDRRDIMHETRRVRRDLEDAERYTK